MSPISLNVAALAVAVIFYTWRGYAQIQVKKQLRLRERVAFMLWMSTQGACDRDVIRASR